MMLCFIYGTTAGVHFVLGASYIQSKHDYLQAMSCKSGVELVVLQHPSPNLPHWTARMRLLHTTAVLDDVCSTARAVSNRTDATCCPALHTAGLRAE
jgi:hypothetical protein